MTVINTHALYFDVEASLLITIWRMHDGRLQYKNWTGVGPDGNWSAPMNWDVTE